MSGFGLKLIKRPPDAAKIAKNINFGVAWGFTQTAKEGQKASQGALRGTFTIRNKWPEIGPLAIKIKPATRDDLSAEIRTNAEFLLPHEEGKAKFAKGGRIAVPTENVRRNKRLIIQKSQRPKGLAGKAFVLKTKRGPVLAQRISRGKNKGLRVLYGLEPSVRIRKQSTFYEPIDRTVRKRLNPNVLTGIRKALATMK